MRNLVSEKTDIPQQNILIHATHSHSGPGLHSQRNIRATDEQIQQCLTTIAQSIIQAQQNLAPAELSIGYTSEDRVSFNRRLKCTDGTTHMNWEQLDTEFVEKPWGLIDPELIAVFIQQHQQPAAALINFGLHPAVLAGDNWLYSADYPGYLAQALRQLEHDDFMTLFFNGCCGNVNHIDYTDPTQGRGYQMTQRIGYMLAVAAKEAQRSANPISFDSIQLSHELVSLPRYTFTAEQLDWARDVIEQAEKNPAQGQVDGRPDQDYAQTWLKLAKKQDNVDQVEVMAIKIGELAIVGLPGEIFCELGMQIKQQSPAKHTIVIELANDALGYFPTLEAFAQGGYEVTPGTTKYQPGAGEKLVNSTITQLQQLYAK